ncbi:MAG: leucyl aminopeptidase [Gammaproteobacteria bacterium]|jgi:leucyl aminopeptidase|nr:leucyl aminopeptidase [Gammaproteobacteria bacterium]
MALFKYYETAVAATPIRVLTPIAYATWLSAQGTHIQNWLNTSHFVAENEKWTYVLNAESAVTEVLLICDNPEKRLSGAAMATQLPIGEYVFVREGLSVEALFQLTRAWGLAHYQFNRYRTLNQKEKPCLYVQESDRLALQWVESIHMVRDLINTPAEDLGPEELAFYCRNFCDRFSGTMKEVIGSDLLAQGYPLIHAVGRGSDREPRLIDMRLGKSHDPLLILIGKGVCFDSGGLDIKSADNMFLMKKDMGGAAHVLGLAQMILLQKLPIQLRILIPAVENVISAKAFKPGDVYVARNGLSVEIGNTDAEGRLILADALLEAATDEARLVIDFATLTGAARVALGPDIPVFFCNDKQVQMDIMAASEKTGEWLWPLPLYAAYKDYLKSPVADISNSGGSYAGAITAALFLQAFAPATIPWIHIDLMAYNLNNQSGRPQGGEAMGLDAILTFIKHYF